MSANNMYDRYMDGCYNVTESRCNKNIEQYEAIAKRWPILKGICKAMIKFNYKQLEANSKRHSKIVAKREQSK